MIESDDLSQNTKLLRTGRERLRMNELEKAVVNIPRKIIALAASTLVLTACEPAQETLCRNIESDFVPTWSTVNLPWNKLERERVQWNTCTPKYSRYLTKKQSFMNTYTDINIS